MAKIPSRAVRFLNAVDKIEDAKLEVEELRDELQNWLDNLPENLQSGSRADSLQKTIDNLGNIISHLEETTRFMVMFSRINSFYRNIFK